MCVLPVPSMPLSPLKVFRSPFQDLPFDILPPVLSQLSDNRDWHACALVNKTFHRVATPLLYRTLDSRIISKASRGLRIVHLRSDMASRLSCIILRLPFFSDLNLLCTFDMLQKQVSQVAFLKPYLINEQDPSIAASYFVILTSQETL